MHGLHHTIAMKRMAAGELARQARRPACDPRTAHEKNVEAERLAKEAETLCDHLAGNLQVLESIEHLLNYLGRSPHQSRYRNLSVISLEQAHSWLQRENGDKEPDRNFQAINGQAVS